MNAPRDLDRFVHDLRRFLREIVSEAQLAVQRDVAAMPPDTRASLERIAAAGAAGDDLVRAMYEFETAEARPDVRAPLDALLRLAEIQVRAEMGNADLTVECDSPGVSAPASISAVVAELARNAAKFGASRILVRAAAGRELRIEVSDDGIGIAPEHHRQIFEPYRRLHPVGEYSGHGLGLAAAERCVRQLGGSIAVQRSSVGSGSTFAVALPLDPPAA